MYMMHQIKRFFWIRRWSSLSSSSYTYERIVRCGDLDRKRNLVSNVSRRRYARSFPTLEQVNGKDGRTGEKELEGIVQKKKLKNDDETERNIEDDLEKAALLRRIDDALKRVQAYPPDQEFIRNFWRDRLKRHSSRIWSVRDIIRSIVSRKGPLQVTAVHAAYCSLVTGNFMSLHNDGTMDSEADLLVEYILQHSNVLAGCTGFLATALFLMLSFRINRGVGRWWEGRALYGEMLANLRGLAQASNAYVRNKGVGIDIGLWAYAYARARELHLRKDNDEKYVTIFTGIMSRTELDRMFEYPMRPNFVGEQLTQKLSAAFDRGEVKGIRALVAMEELVQRVIRNGNSLHRIRFTPEPWSYQKHLRFTAMLWLGILPISLMPSLTWFTPILSSAIGYVVFKLDDISVELQNPFGFDRSDLSICLLNDDFQAELKMLLRNSIGSDVHPTERISQTEVDDEVDSLGLSHDK